MNIGFIAMSGVRCRNEELLAYGLTLPGFVERSKVIASLPSLGLLTLAGMTPDEHDITYLEVPDISELNGKLPENNFDVVAISSFSAQIFEAYALADRYRSHGVIVILGGLHVTLCPDEASQHADVVVIGEGEPVWPQLLKDLASGKLKPSYDARLDTFDFADSPMPRFDLLDIAKYNRLTVQTQRGCPFSCDFCAASIRLNPRFRVKPVHRVLDEIRIIKKIWPNPFLEFADDNTFANKPHGKKLVEALAEEGLRWFTETDISVADDPDLLKLMKASGCAQILIGLESIDAAGLNHIETRGNWKIRQLSKYKDAISRIQDAGITVNGCFVFGLDRTSTSSFDGVFDFVKSSGLYEVQITVMTPFPGTPLYDRLYQEGRLTHPGEWDRCTLFDVNFIPEQMTIAELESGFRKLAGRIYDPEFVEARRRQFFIRQDELRNLAK